MLLIVTCRKWLDKVRMGSFSESWDSIWKATRRDERRERKKEGSWCVWDEVVVMVLGFGTPSLCELGEIAFSEPHTSNISQFLFKYQSGLKNAFLCVLLLTILF